MGLARYPEGKWPLEAVSSERNRRGGFLRSGRVIMGKDLELLRELKPGEEGTEGLVASVATRSSV